ncbi:MAG: hypothetical protein FWB76_01065 [Oscillospiraceae bacterium]|nr:hypothetical protein [Oscillospiraceae bacterium]
MNKVVSIALLVAGLILVGMSGYYIVQIVRLGLWDDIIFRVVSALAFIGGGVFIGLSRALTNQRTLIELLRNKGE